jgi:hypothetical protein
VHLAKHDWSTMKKLVRVELRVVVRTSCMMVVAKTSCMALVAVFVTISRFVQENQDPTLQGRDQ